MNRHTWILFVAALSLILAAGAYLATIGSRQRLGPPGVKVVAEPIQGETVKPDGVRESFLAGTNSVALPVQVLDYVSKPIPVDRVVWDWLPKDTTYGQRLYTASDGFTISTTVVLMGRDRTSIHEPEHCLVGGGWRVTGKEAETVPMQRPLPYELAVTKLAAMREVKNEKGEPVTLTGVFVYWFVSDNELSANHLKRMWSLAVDILKTGVLRRWAYVSCFTVCQTGAEEAALSRMKQFIAAATPEFQLLPKASATGAAEAAAAKR